MTTTADAVIIGGGVMGCSIAYNLAAKGMTEVVLLGNIALRRQLREALTHQKLHWDGPAMKITNLPEANQYLHREYRAGWTL